MKMVDVITTVHVEEHVKFVRDCHVGHAEFYKLILKEKCPIPLTLLIGRVKEEEKCPACDKSVLNEIDSMGLMEIGLHVHPALSRYTHKGQQEIVNYEYKRMVEETGIIPKSFSGGHWCINADTLKIIKELGIVVDASVAPGCTVYSCNGTVIRYSNKFCSPYWVSTDNIDKEDQEQTLLEMPVSIKHNGKIMDITTSLPWEITTSFHIYSSKHINYIHMTYHSYDMLFANGGKNFIYDKMMHICDSLHKHYDIVNFLTCHQYYHKKKGEKQNEDINRIDRTGENVSFAKD